MDLYTFGNLKPGLALFSTGTLYNDEDSGPANTTECVFEQNSVSDGGGMYSVSGYDIISDSCFEANIAGEQFLLALRFCALFS